MVPHLLSIAAFHKVRYGLLTFFADLFKPYLERSEIIKYADDATIIFPIRKSDTRQDISDMIKSEIENADHWCSLNKQKMNKNKLQIMTIGKQIPIDTQISFPFLEEIKILGLILNNKLNWKSHFDYVIKKANSRVFAFNKASKLLNKKELKILYQSSISSLFEYACPVFSVLTKEIQRKLRRIQQK